MLAMRPHCLRCQAAVPPESTQVVICSFECTYCAACNRDHLHGVCPNCQGQLVPRPTRIGAALVRHPAATT
jgi:uncharacterized protein